MTARWARCTPTRPREAMSRLESMITMGGFQLPTKTIREMIVGSIDVIIQAERLRDGSRRITKITEVVGTEGDVVITQDLLIYEISGEDDSGRIKGRHVGTGIVRPTFWERARYYGLERDLADALDKLQVVSDGDRADRRLAGAGAGRRGVRLCRRRRRRARRSASPPSPSRRPAARGARGAETQRAAPQERPGRCSRTSRSKQAEKKPKLTHAPPPRPGRPCRRHAAHLLDRLRRLRPLSPPSSASIARQTLLVVALARVRAPGFGLPRWVLGFLKARREKRFTDDFANAIDVIVRSVKSGLPTNDALRIVAREFRDPVGGEFKRLCEGMKVGVTLEQGLKRMYESMPTTEVSFFGIVMTIQQKSGGNLSEALGNLAGVLRDRKRLQGKIKAMSSEAKASADDHRLAAARRDGHRLSDDARLHLAAVHRADGQSDAGGLRRLDEHGHLRHAQDDQLQALRRAACSASTSSTSCSIRRFLVTPAVAIFAFATIVTLGLPLLERDTLGERLKAVAERREELRARHHAALNAKRGSLRSEPVGSTKLIKQIVERFNLGQAGGVRGLARQAGARRLSRPDAATSSSCSSAS